MPFAQPATFPFLLTPISVNNSWAYKLGYTISDEIYKCFLVVNK